MVTRITHKRKNNNASFLYFSSLPPELRIKVWHQALPRVPHINTPCFFHYKTGCWHPYPDPDDERCLVLEFQHQGLDTVQIALPLALTNREARSIVLAWAHELGIESHINICKELQGHVYTPSFDPAQDLLHITHDRWDDFLNDTSNRPFEPDVMGVNFTLDCAVTRISVPDTLLLAEDNHEALIWMLDHWHYQAEILFIIIGEQPNSASLEETGLKIWGIESGNTPPAAFVWDADSESFEWGHGERTGDDILHERVEEMRAGMASWLTDFGKARFEIRLVYATRI